MHWRKVTNAFPDSTQQIRNLHAIEVILVVLTPLKTEYGSTDHVGPTEHAGLRVPWPSPRYGSGAGGVHHGKLIKLIVEDYL